MIASNVYVMLKTDMGGIDWDGLPLACAYHGVSDIEGLIDRLLVIKLHSKPKDD